MTRARFPLCLLLSLSVVIPFSACGRYSNVPPPPPSARSVPAETAEQTPAQKKTPASSADLERYAQREREASGLERFAGGRMSDATLIVLVLLLVIIIILLV